MISATGIVWLILGLGVLLFIINGLIPRKSSTTNHLTRATHTFQHPHTSAPPGYQSPGNLPPEYYLWRARIDSFRIPRSLRYAHGDYELRRRTIFEHHLQQTLKQQNNVKTLHQTWRRSIVGLRSLAHSHLQLANKKLQLHSYEEAIAEADTSVENIARALLYCYGDKPNPEAGQEEPLKMLAARLKGPDRIVIESAIDSISVIYRKRIDLKKLESPAITMKFFDGENTRQLVDLARSVVNALQQVMDNRFRLEIPELTAQGAIP